MAANYHIRFLFAIRFAVRATGLDLPRSSKRDIPLGDTPRFAMRTYAGVQKTPGGINPMVCFTVAAVPNSLAAVRT
jgi:hypothetical protein